MIIRLGKKYVVNTLTENQEIFRYNKEIDQLIVTLANIMSNNENRIIYTIQMWIVLKKIWVTYNSQCKVIFRLARNKKSFYKKKEMFF